MSPRVLIVVPHLAIGGTEMHLVRVVPELRQGGLEISVFVLSRGGDLERDLSDMDIPLFGGSRLRPRLLNAAVAGYRLRWHLRRTRPNIVHFFLPEAYLIGSVAASGLDIIRIMSRRSLALYQHKHPLIARLEKRLHRSTRILIGNSRAVAAELVRECDEAAKVRLIHNGIEMPLPSSPEQRIACRRIIGVPEDAFVIAVVANLIPYKGHRDLFEALSLVRLKIKPWRLLVVGRDEGIGRELRRRATELGIAENILWFAETRDVDRLLDATDLAVLPSHEEGFSNSLLEKMAHALAVIATAVGGNLDAILDGISGRLVPPRDPVALSQAIFELHEDQALRRRLGTAARERVQEFFSLEACVARYFQLYAKLSQSAGPPVMELIVPTPPARA